MEPEAGGGWGVESSYVSMQVCGDGRAIGLGPKPRATPHPALRATLPQQAGEGVNLWKELSWIFLPPCLVFLPLGLDFPSFEFGFSFPPGLDDLRDQILSPENTSSAARAR